MKPIIILCILLGLFTTEANARQKTPEEINEMVRLMQRRHDSLMNNPKFRQMIEKGKDLKKTGVIIPPVKMGPRQQGPLQEFPKPGPAALKRISKEILNQNQLASYLVEVHQKFAVSLPEPAESARAIANKLDNDPGKIEQAAILAYMRGSPQECLMLITDAAARSQENGMLLANAGALLDMCGMPELAIPVLRSIAYYQPGNNVALNNLGQAFAQLGMLDSAMHYLQRCIAGWAKHPEANTTAGYIELLRGNKARAKSYFENALRGGFHTLAYSSLFRIDEDFNMAPLVRPLVKIPEHYNSLKYELPRQCTSVERTNISREEHLVYREMLSAEIQKFYNLRKQAEKELSAITTDEMLRKMKEKGANAFRPFYQFGYTMMVAVTHDYTKELIELEKYNLENRRLYKDTMTKYKALLWEIMQRYGGHNSSCCGEGNTSCCPDLEERCREVNALGNKYLPVFAKLNEEWQMHTTDLYRKYLDELIYWNFLGSMSDDLFRNALYAIIGNYLEALRKVCETTLFETCVPPSKPEVKEPVVNEFRWECLFGLDLPLVIGKFELNCEKFSLKIGEGVAFKFEKSFTGKRETTVGIAFGASLYLMPKIWKVKVGAELKAEAMMYFVFDNQWNLVDEGVLEEAKVEAGLMYETEDEFKDKIKLKLPHLKAKIGARLSVNSGLSFDEGPLRQLYYKIFDIKPEHQINKNVRIYNSHQ